MAKASEAKIAANNRYKAKNYVYLGANVRPKVRDDITAFATANGESIAGFITRACYEAMDKSNGGNRADEPQNNEITR